MSDMNSTTSPTSRPAYLTRSTSDRKVAGVSGGLAAHFGVDPLLVRIGFVVTTLVTGAGLLAYLALALLVPSDDAPAAAVPAAA
jgi:phage shock protein PspC (stress-responsive transcriptional regulator)